MEDLRVAAVVMRSELGRIGDNLARMASLVAEASDQGAQMVCFPEACVSGYGIHPEVRRYAEPIPGAVSSAVLRMAESSGITILAGLIERDKRDALFLTQIIATPGGMLGTYRKVHLGPPEQGVYRAGRDVPVFEDRGVSIGIQLCYDGHFPELSTLLTLKGAEVLCVSHASPHESPKEKLARWLRYLPARAYDNGVFVVACNQAGENGSGLTFPGVALVLDPKGRVLASQCGEQEGLTLATLEAQELARVRSRPLAHFLRHRRPEIYRLSRDS